MILGEHVALGRALKLAFANHVHDLIAAQSPPGGAKRPKAQTGIGQALDETVVLFNDIVEVFSG